MRAELRALASLASLEEARFFQRNPHLIAPYRNRLVAVALCQGAALQYLGRGYGVADFDVHLFYDQNPAKPRLSRTVKSTHTTVGSFQDVRVDFVRTVIPKLSATSIPTERIRHFLTSRPTPNAAKLATKAVVGLLPEHLFGVAIWPAV